MEHMSESRRTKWAALLVLSAATVLPARAQVPADIVGAGVDAAERQCSVRRGRCVFGAHGMGQDTILRNLALLNVPRRARTGADGGRRAPAVCGDQSGAGG